jgi:hypothetical protein
VRHIHPSMKPSDNFSVRLLVSLLLFRVCLSVLRLAVRRVLSCLRLAY